MSGARAGLRSAGRRLRTRVRKTLRIARWELGRSTGTIDRRTALLGLVGVLVAALVAPAALGGGVAVDEGIYRVGVDESNPYYAAVENSSTFRPVDPDRHGVEALRGGDVELLIEGDRITYDDERRKSEAALAEFKSAVEAHNYRLMEREDNETAAFPVIVELRYEDRSTSFDPGTDVGPSGASGDGDGDGSAGGGDGSASDDGTDDGAGGDDAGDGDSSGGTGTAEVGGDGGGWFGSAIVEQGRTDTPAGISPPFPFGSLVLAFLFIVPMNFVIQIYGGSIMNERINRRGELLLVAPVSRGEIVAGKTLPYLGALVVVSTAIAAAIGGGPLSVAAVVPVALLFLAASFVGAMFARSFKELTFVTVTISVTLSSYVFVPAIFTDVVPVALISPLTLVVWDLQGQAVAPWQYAFSTGPFYLTSALLFALGAGVYREEDMFSQRAVHLKAMDALANYVRGPRSVAAVTALSVPFVFVAQLLAVAVLFVLPTNLSLPVLLVVVAVVEELAKSLHVYAGYEHKRFDRSARTALVVGFASGVGFFLAEKATHVVQVVGLHKFDAGRAAFQTFEGVGIGLGAVLFLLPLALHTVTAAVSALGARRDRVHYGATLVVAMSLHVLYNWGVMTYVA